MTDMNPSPAPSGASAAAEKPAAAGRLLGAADIRHIAAEAGISPTKKFGQNFVIDPGTVRRIVREAAVTADTRVLEVGPGLGSLTLAILETGATMTAVEIDPPVAQRLPHTILTSADLPEFSGDEPFTLVANLPYNVATPIILTLLERFDMLTSFVVMVQKEVADRLTATPGSKIYGAPSVKLAWYGSAERVGNIGRHVFWPAPNVDSALAGFTRVQSHAGPRDPQLRQLTFQLVDAAFSQRRKTLHAALKRMVPDEVFHTAGIDPTRRGETLTIDEFAALATALRQSQHEQGQASS